jgi:preprotein translocase subunit YajC
MTRTFVRTMSFTIIVALVLVATTAMAQETRINGTVSRTDPVTRTIYFADGSAVRLQPGAVIMMNGSTVPFESLTPGANTTVVSTAAAGSAASQTASSTADVVGTVAQVDQQSGTITLQDGRQVKLGGQSVVWQAMPITAIQPGTQVYVHNVQPLAAAAAPAPAAQAYDPNVQVGTVKYVDQGARLIALTDGTFVKVNRDTRLDSAGRPVALAEVRPGDVVAVRPEGNPSAAHSGPSGTAGLGTKPATVTRGDGSPVSAVQADSIEVRRPASAR